LVILYPD